MPLSGPPGPATPELSEAELERFRDETRLQIVLARLDALARWNEVGRTVAACASREKAAVALVESGFDAQWVDHILDMRLTERTIEGLVTLERERDELLSRLRS